MSVTIDRHSLILLVSRSSAILNVLSEERNTLCRFEESGVFLSYSRRRDDIIRCDAKEIFQTTSYSVDSGKEVESAV